MKWVRFRSRLGHMISTAFTLSVVGLIAFSLVYFSFNFGFSLSLLQTIFGYIELSLFLQFPLSLSSFSRNACLFVWRAAPL
jgi:hypothetical protein